MFDKKARFEPLNKILINNKIILVKIQFRKILKKYCMCFKNVLMIKLLLTTNDIRTFSEFSSLKTTIRNNSSSEKVHFCNKTFSNRKSEIQQIQVRKFSFHKGKKGKIE